MNISMLELQELLRQGNAPKYVEYNWRKYKLCCDKKDYMNTVEIVTFLSDDFYSKNFLLISDSQKDIYILTEEEYNGEKK